MTQMSTYKAVTWSNKSALYIFHHYWHIDLQLLQERILLDPMFDVPGSDVVDVIITEETVKENAPAQYVTQPSGEGDEASEQPIDMEEQPLQYQEAANP